MDLPDEILCLLFNDLSLDELKAIRLVCWKWYGIVRERKTLWWRGTRSVKVLSWFEDPSLVVKEGFVQIQGSGERDLLQRVSCRDLVYVLETTEDMQALDSFPIHHYRHITLEIQSEISILDVLKSSVRLVRQARQDSARSFLFHYKSDWFGYGNKTIIWFVSGMHSFPIKYLLGLLPGTRLVLRESHEGEVDPSDFPGIQILRSKEETVDSILQIINSNHGQ